MYEFFFSYMMNADVDNAKPLLKLKRSHVKSKQLQLKNGIAISINDSVKKKQRKQL